MKALLRKLTRTWGRIVLLVLLVTFLAGLGALVYSFKQVVDTHYFQGRRFLANGLYDEAIASFKKGLELDPDDDELHGLLGDAYREKGLYDEAIASYNKALELEPAEEPGSFRAIYHNDMAGAFLFKGEYEQARKQLREALRLALTELFESSVHGTIAFSYFLESRFDEAIKEFEESEKDAGMVLSFLRSLEAYPIIHYHLSLKHVGRQSEAQKLLQDYVKEFKGNEWELSLLHYHQGKLTESELLSRARDKEKQCEAYFYVGSQYLVKGDKQKAREYFQKTIDTKVSNYLEFIAARARLKQLGTN